MTKEELKAAMRKESLKNNPIRGTWETATSINFAPILTGKAANKFNKEANLNYQRYLEREKLR